MAEAVWRIANLRASDRGFNPVAHVSI
ncbi:hypothetical protein FP2506_07116 [Fulvimarina pelagi HTCC2506]|uniref:Uncharacterized protein n=1 Tax=Fulvimarina pelagi HTCC2506 TaxID=314231 RepID=Q0G6X3_9HYPH|nr:hypothetical protein FP2506_07116 [Fulvimarina pelagi HTCC2506]